MNEKYDTIEVSLDCLGVADIEGFDGLHLIPLKGECEVLIEYTPADDHSYDNHSVEWKIIENNVEIDFPLLLSNIVEYEDTHDFTSIGILYLFVAKVKESVMEHFKETLIPQEVSDWNPL